MTVSFRLWYRKLGGHVYVRVFSSEFGPDTTHGSNGSLTFRESQWPAFRRLLERGRLHGPGEATPPVVEFVDESGAEMAS